MQFQPVWISSPEHLAQFDGIIARTAKWRRSLGFYQLPAEFPRVDMGRKILGKSVVVPLVMVSQGELTIEGDILRYRALDSPMITVGRTTATRHHLRTDWQWELRAENIRSVEPFERPSPVLTNFSLPFTRVRARHRARHREAVLNDLLICVGGSGHEMEKLREQSAQLTAQLQRLKSG